MSTRRIIQFLTGIALIIGIVWLIKKPDYEPALTTIALFATLIGEIVEEKISGNRAVDLETFKRLKETIPSEGSIDFIRHHNMSGFSFDLDHLDDLDKFYFNWNDAEHEFLTKSLEIKKKKLHSLVGKYLDSIGVNTYPTHRPGTNTVPPEWEIEQTERFREIVNELHDLARKVVAAHQDLFRTARNKLKC